MNRDQLIGKDPEQSDISAGTQPGIVAGTTRRRLLKGAAMGAPVILTLRSGAVMSAGSCTGIMNTDATTPGDAYSDDVCIQANSEMFCRGGNGVSDYTSSTSPVEKTTTTTECTLFKGNGECKKNGWTTTETGTGKYYCPTTNPVLISANAFHSLSGTVG